MDPAQVRRPAAVFVDNRHGGEMLGHGVPNRNSTALVPTRAVDRLYARALDRSVGHRFRDATPTETEVIRYLDSLHVEDLALATACAVGADAAWEHVITTLRPALYAAARALTKDEASARELADTFWAELYGVGSTKASVEPGTERRPLLSYFHGRSKLSTWLRSVLAQRHVEDPRHPAGRSARRGRAGRVGAARRNGGPRPGPLPDLVGPGTGPGTRRARGGRPPASRALLPAGPDAGRHPSR